MPQEKAPRPESSTLNYSTSAQQRPRVVARVLLLYAHDQRRVGAPVAFTLPQGATPIGREAAGTDEDRVAVPDPHVSLHHATLLLRDDRVTLRHEKTTNVTRVNGEPLAAGVERTLQDGDVLRVGPTAFLLLRREPEMYVPAPVAGLLGHSYAMASFRARLLRAGRTRPPLPSLLLTGENGTGKELAAQALHQLYCKGLGQGPFIPVNCGAIAGTLIESELFGHRRGAFTGATADRKGAFAAAHGGTLFLDEVGDLDRAVQVQLLRALQERRIKPVGDEREQEVDVRVLCATHRDVAGAVGRGEFREDLYYRLAKLVLELPPLRERREDVLPLLSHLLRESGARDGAGGGLPPLHPDLVEALLCHRWPGNVRELGNVADQLRLHLPDTELLDLSHVDLADPAPPPAVPGASAPQARRPPRERGAPMPPDEELRRLLELYQGKLAKVARALGEDRKTLRNHLRRRGLYEGGDGDE